MALDPYFANVRLLLHCDGAAGSTAVVDSSVADKAPILNSVPLTTTMSKFGGSSLHFTAFETLTLPAGEEVFLGDFTMEMFAWSNNSGYDPGLIDSNVHSSSAASGSAFRWCLTTAGNLVWEDITNHGPAVAKLTGTATLNDGQWHHIAASRNSGVLRFFVDGVLDGQVALSTPYSYMGSAVAVGHKGAHYSPSPKWFSGYIDELRITRDVGRYTTNFTPPTEPFPDSGPIHARVLVGGVLGSPVAVATAVGGSPPAQPPNDTVFMTTVKHYRSDMPGAPVLNGVAGSKNAQLEACLVTGYGLKAVTSLVVAGGTATLTFAGGASAAWQDAVVLVAGASNAALNGEQKVLTADATAVTFATAQPNGTDAGSAITFKIAPAGWEKVYSSPDVAVFRSLHPDSTRMCLRVDDTNAQFVRVVSYETMSGVDTGLGPFPTGVQRTGGGYWAKSDVTSITAVAWILASDGRFFHDSTAPGSHRGMTYQNSVLRGFGEFVPKNPAGDYYLCGLNYSITTSVANMYDGSLDYNSAVSQTAMARGHTGLGTSVLGRRAAYSGNSGASAGSGADGVFGSFPSPVDGSLLLSSQYVTDTGAPRGDIPGLKYCPQSGVWGTFKMFDTLAHGGRKYITSSSGGVGLGIGSAGVSSSGGTGASFIDITGPWR